MLLSCSDLNLISLTARTPACLFTFVQQGKLGWFGGWVETCRTMQCNPSFTLQFINTLIVLTGDLGGNQLLDFMLE